MTHLYHDVAYREHFRSLYTAVLRDTVRSICSIRERGRQWCCVASTADCARMAHTIRALQVSLFLLLLWVSMFYVRHHNDEVTILNSKCHTMVLLDCLKKLAGDALPAGCSVDLIPVGPSVDHKNQQPLLMGEKLEAGGVAIYATTYVAPRSVYALLSSREEEDGLRVLKPLWTAQHKEESDKLTAILETRQSEERKKLAGKKAKK